MNKFLLSLFIATLAFHVGNAQQDPIYAQYLTNPLVINPAYAGINNQFNARLQFRTQWAGIEANPKTFNLSSSTSLEQNKVGLGLILLQDKLGDIRNIEVSVPLSYKVKVKESWLSFGMQAGFVNQKNDASKLNIFDPGDPAFMPYSETSINLGAGVMFKHDKYRVGLSVPRLLPATINTSGSPIELYKQHYYLFGSYNFRVSDYVWFKPSALLRGTSGIPLSADINATFTYRDNYSAGIFTRNFNTYGALVQVLVKQWHIGYVFELPGSKTSSIRFTSHEITIGLTRAIKTYPDLVPKVF